jgi:hypothetical protein
MGPPSGQLERRVQCTVTVIPQQIEIEQAVGIGEEDRLPAIAALGDVMRDVGDDDAGEAGHGGRVSRKLV